MEPLTNEWREVVLKPQFIFRVGVLVLLGFMSVRFLHPLSLSMVLSMLIGIACLACQILSAQAETRRQKPETRN